MQVGKLAIFENITDAYFAVDNSWCFTYVNAKALRLLKKNREELIGKKLTSVLSNGVLSPVFLRCQEAVTTRQPIEFPVYLPNMQVRCKAVPFPEGVHVFAQPQRKRSLPRLDDKALLALFEQLPFGIALFDTELRFLQANQLFADFFRRSPATLRGRVLYDVISEVFGLDYAERIMAIFRKTLETGEAYTADTGLPDAQADTDWTLKRLEVNKAIAGLMLTMANISCTTDPKLMEKEMLRLDRLNLVGQMAAAISHEVRNPMTTVRGFLQMMSRKDDCTHYREYIELMISELDRANSIISEFLSVAKTKQVNFVEADLNSIIRTIEPLLATEAVAKGNTLTLELGEIHPFCLNEREIRQLLLNLVRNGFEAMPQRGTVTVRTYEEDNQVVLAVQDEGTGIPSQILPKLGTPFLTSKPTGTGLGLPVCYGIVERHKGRIEVATGPEGTTFFIRFIGNG